MTRRVLDIQTADGVAKAHLFQPEKPAASRAGVILYMDAFGLRDGLDQMAERLAGQGYVVLVPDLFYRFGAYGPFDAKTAFSHEESRAKLMSMLNGTTHEMTARDTAAFLDTLAAEGATGPIGVTGYCFGGGRALTALATYPDRVVSAASFHGGNLASDAPNSPHLKAAAMRGRVYIGSAGVDGSFPPEQSARLESALRMAGVDYIMENYIGMEHGWTVPDSRVHNPAGAERHWARLTTFFAETLV
ncbi:MAG: dienelactone hydrolase family protein [Mesorhizobium sp.]|nr:dienelactone hydrolase family protein [Mesorhizobium sp.]